jgi:hypothetical protein
VDAPTTTISLRTELRNGGLVLLAKRQVGQATVEDELGTISASIPAELHDGLLGFQQRVRPLRNDLATAGDALTTLRNKGGEVGDGIIDVGVWRKLCNLLEAVIPRPRIDGQPPIIEISGDTLLLFPFELLPLLETRFPPRIGTEDELYEAAGAFLGFAAVVRRIPPAGYEPPLPLTGSPLTVALFRDETIRGAKLEELFFANDQRVKLQTTWPLPQTDAAHAAALLCGRLVDPMAQLEGAPPTAADQVQHFACHCFSNADALTLRLGSTSTPHDVSYDQIRTALQRARPKGPLPLLFMNACGSATVSPRSNVSLTRLFIGNGNRGFIGTHAPIPDQLASRFSRAFYEHLLNGASVSTALWRARWRMLHRYKNPLGILYTLYADAYFGIDSAGADSAGAVDAQSSSVT